MSAKKTTCTCPICKQIFPRSAASFPFCSDRCKQIDLGAWASGKYVVAGSAIQLDEDLGLDENSAASVSEDDESDPSHLIH